MTELVDILKGAVVGIIGIVILVTIVTTLVKTAPDTVRPIISQMGIISIILIIVGTLSTIFGFLFKK